MTHTLTAKHEQFEIEKKILKTKNDKKVEN